MANFIAKRIKDRQGRLIGVLTRTEDGEEIPFTIRKGKIVRMDLDVPDRPFVSDDIFWQLSRQAGGVLWGEMKMKSEKTPPGEAMEISRKWLSAYDKKRLRILSDNGIKYLADGTLEISRWEKSGNRLKKIPQIVRDLPAAIRMQEHALSFYELTGYGLPELKDSKAVLYEINFHLTRWKKSGKDEREKIELLIAEMILRLKHCRNDYNRYLLRQLKGSTAVMDRSGKTNPGSTAARLTAGLERLTDRLNQVGAIIPKLAMRKELLSLEENSFQSHLGEIRRILSWIRDNPGRKKEIDQDIGQVLHLISKFWVMPYKEIAGIAEPFLKEAKGALRQNDLKSLESMIEEAIITFN